MLAEYDMFEEASMWPVPSPQGTESPGNIAQTKPTQSGFSDNEMVLLIEHALAEGPLGTTLFQNHPQYQHGKCLST